MPIPRMASVGAVDLCVDTLGDPTNPAFLLIAGLGRQLIDWPSDLCTALSRRGFHVIRFDNRDSGRSTHLPGTRYALADLARDVAGLLDALGHACAHLAGAGLGLNVALALAHRDPTRVLSVASLPTEAFTLDADDARWTAELSRARDPDREAGRRRQLAALCARAQWPRPQPPIVHIPRGPWPLALDALAANAARASGRQEAEV